MPITKEQKIKITESLKTEIARAGSLVFVNFHGLSSALLTGLRRSLKASGISYTVVKKTLLTRALTAATAGKITGEPPALDGEVAIAYAPVDQNNEDQSLWPAKNIYEFQIKTKEGLKILGGIFGGEFVSAEKMINLAMIPSRQTLYGQLVGLLAWPFRGLVVSLDQVAKKEVGGAKMN